MPVGRKTHDGIASLQPQWQRRWMPRALIVLSIGAFFGLSIGLMFDNKATPGVAALLGTVIGMIVAALAWLRLRRCDPFGASGNR